MGQKKLAQLFEENKSRLYKELQDLYLPQDIQKLQKVITSFFDEQLSPSGEYGQGLKQAEMHLLNSTVKIWQTQIKLQSLLLNSDSQTVSKSPIKINKSKRFSKVDSKNAIIGTLVGSAVGAFFYPIVTLAGALAGLCAAIYLADKLPNHEIEQSNNESNTLPLAKKVIDVELIIRIMKEMCENIDNIILTFNVQIKNLTPEVVTGFENQYPDILEAFQKFAGGISKYEKDTTYATIFDKYSFIEDALAQHGILIQHYNDTEKDSFEIQEKENIDGIKEVLPALTKNGNVVKRGKILISKKYKI